MSSAQQATQTLTAQWYNALTAGLNLDPNTFQLIQSNQPLGTTSPQLWAYFDALPPLSVSHLFNPSQFDSFAQNYNAVVMNLLPQNSGAFIQAMGDSYPVWAAYLKTVTQLPSGGMTQLFSDWAQLHISDPGTAQQVITLYGQIQNGAVPTATRMLLAAGTAGVRARIRWLSSWTRRAPRR